MTICIVDELIVIVKVNQTFSLSVFKKRLGRILKQLHEMSSDVNADWNMIIRHCYQIVSWHPAKVSRVAFPSPRRRERDENHLSYDWYCGHQMK